MLAPKIIFWLCAAIIFYAYIGYALILYILVKIKRLSGKQERANTNYEPDVTLLIAAYNEKDYVDEKMHNTLQLDYPASKLTILWVTDGSNDGTPEAIRQYTQAVVEHQEGRAGKIGAINRGMRLVKTPITIFCDANTHLGKDSIRRIVALFANPKVGCVSGEKRILLDEKEAASAAGEGAYWKYESTLKRWDSELNSVVGAAGELFAIRTELFEEVEKDTLLDDFMISMRIALRGYKIKYDPEAYAAEKASANVKEELKRKIRISAGGIQSIVRLSPLLNILKYGLLSFQYISHRVLRWTLAPLSLLLILLTNTYIAIREGFSLDSIYTWTLFLQIAFYLLALVGYILENKKLHIKGLFIPYFFYIMNYAVFRGFFRYLNRTQTVNWERAKRA
jgi:cellulose synthase/poly-beta-1,6-N-acetylglucosamine synthase-like glycosyltransferase